MLSRFILSVLIVQASLYAHTGHAIASGWFAGITHPFGGLDHVAAMMASGFWAIRLGGRAIWALPFAFTVGMSAGAVAAVLGFGLGWAETAVLGSVVVLGGLAVFGTRFALAYVLALISAVAYFHGMVHGAEMPASAGGMVYGAGFILSTLVLHAMGMIAALTLQRKEPVRV